MEPYGLRGSFVYRSIDNERVWDDHSLYFTGLQPGRYHSVHGRRFYRERDPLYGGYALPKTHQRNDVNKILASWAGGYAIGRKAGINNCLLINDTYNSDINSLDIALDFQQSRRVGKQLKSTLILSDILQSGTLPKSLYKKVADLVRRKKIDRIMVSAAT